MKSLVIALVLFAAACSDGGESDGIRVAIAVEGATMPQTVSLAGGETATLDASYVTVASFTLEPCSSLTTKLWRALDPLPEAFAHGESSPTRLAVPVVVRIAGARSRVDAGHLEPPPGRYCGLELEIAAADDDALELPDAEMVGKSLRVVGEHDGTPFSISSAARLDVTKTFATPLELTAMNNEVSLVMSLDTANSFAAVDLASVSATGDLLVGLAAGFDVTVQ